MNWFEVFTDDRHELDPAPIMVVVGTLAILAISAYATIVNKQAFDALQVGSGCAALIAALFASKYGDAKVRQASPVATVTAAVPADPAYHG